MKYLCPVIRISVSMGRWCGFKQSTVLKFTAVFLLYCYNNKSSIRYQMRWTQTRLHMNDSVP